MNTPVQISFRNLPRLDAVEDEIRKKSEWLERFAPDLMGCHVIIEALHQHHRRGKLMHVHIDLKLPGTELIVRRDPSEHHAHEDINVAIRDSFDAARRQLEDYERTRRGQVKSHDYPPLARVIEIFPSEDYGFLETDDQEKIYFHRNSVLDNHFDLLDVGDEVSFSVEQGVNGPQASTVRRMHG